MNVLKRFYNYNIKPRYANLYGMELYNYDIDFHSSKLGVPYGDYSKGLFRKGQYSYDENGVFVFLDKDANFQYNPCGIAEYALVCFEKMLHREVCYQNKFKSQIEWLETNYSKVSEDKIVWYYKYVGDNVFSGISQGMAICALARAYQYYKDEKYLDMAWKSFHFMNTSLEDGGTRYSGDDYTCWYEEYPSEKSKILNGHIYSLLGIYDLYRVTGDVSLKKCFDLGIDDIKRNIGKFDLGFFTKYDAVSPYPANNSYHYTHITLFKILYMITEDVFFKNYADRFERNHKCVIDKLRNVFYILKLAIRAKNLDK